MKSIELLPALLLVTTLVACTRTETPAPDASDPAVAPPVVAPSPPPPPQAQAQAREARV